jgi:hypothetical protein
VCVYVMCDVASERAKKKERERERESGGGGQAACQKFRAVAAADAA